MAHIFSSRTTTTVFLFCPAAALSLIFSQLFFPSIADPLGSELGSDGYDRLGRSILTSGTLSYHPDRQPTVMRGPGYPALVAITLAICERCYPIAIQFAQAGLHGATCVMIFFIGLRMLERRWALIASLLCAGSPLLIWYTARVVTETISVFLFTAAVFLLISLQQQPAFLRTLLLGTVLGVSALVRQVFLPLVCVVPLLLFVCSGPRREVRHAALVLVIGLLIVIPWTVRNWLITDRFIAVHGLSGYNAQVGDFVTEHVLDSPGGYLNLVLASDATHGGTGSYIWLRKADAQSGAAVDHRLLIKSFQRYIDDPGFFLRKVATNAVLFWGYGSAPTQTVVFMVFQIPLALVFLVAAVRLAKQDGVMGPAMGPVWLVMVYYLGHLPFFAIARYGVVLIPTMAVYAFSLVETRQFRSGENRNVDSSPPL